MWQQSLMDMAFPGLKGRDRIIGVALLLAPVGVVLLLLLLAGLFGRPAEPFDVRRLPGCYVAANAPPIELGMDTVRIVQDGEPRLAMRMERDKMGDAMVIEPDFQLVATGNGRYRFERGGRGGRLWRLRLPSPDTPDQPLAHFAVGASDGRDQVYARANTPTPCRSEK